MPTHPNETGQVITKNINHVVTILLSIIFLKSLPVVEMLLLNVLPYNEGSFLNQMNCIAVWFPVLDTGPVTSLGWKGSCVLIPSNYLGS
jgi:hypothetical protein